MKKLILSAVMMMAFVGTSMAKSGEAEKVALGNSIEVAILKADPCTGVADAMVCLHAGTDDPEIYDFYWGLIYLNCSS